MYKKLLIALLFATTFQIYAQETAIETPQASVEKSVFTVQAGFIGVWANNELRLSNQFALRSEIGYELGVVTYSNSDDNEYFGIPSISIEPKWYYNLKKRIRKGRNISGNSGNSFSIRALYNPDWLLITNQHNFYVIDQIAIIPKWTIRRVYGKHFVFETGFGLGPVIYTGKNTRHYSGSDVYTDLHVRIGYRF